MLKYKLLIIWMILLNLNTTYATNTTKDVKSVTTVLPAGFVYLHEIDPSIIIDMKYAGNDNFIGRKINGYLVPVAILTKEAAVALSNVQNELKQHGYSLVVYDAYRPEKAVKQFINWAETDNQKTKMVFYPYIEKAQIIPFGYVATKSSHSRGSTVDVTIISLSHTVKPVNIKNRTLLDGTKILYRDDGTEDMGSFFDLFDTASHYGSAKIDHLATNKRRFLRDIMTKHHFLPLEKEWWHYTLDNEPFPNTYFDFDIK